MNNAQLKERVQKYADYYKKQFGTAKHPDMKGIGRYFMKLDKTLNYTVALSEDGVELTPIIVTKNRFELKQVIKALKSLTPKVTVFTRCHGVND